MACSGGVQAIPGIHPVTADHRCPPTGETTMLRKLLATSALIAIGATSLHSAFAADAGDRGELRQLVIEPAGTKAPAATTADAGKEDLKFILKQGGIPTP